MLTKKGWGIAFGLCMAISLSQLITTPANAQPKDWGDVSEEELRMTVFPDDSSAAAVVLFDKAEFEFTDNFEYEMERHVRIKILREEGYSWATVLLSYNEEFGQNISRIRGQTFTISNDGDVERHKMGRDAVFTEDVGEQYVRHKFTLPALEPGAVIEYRYRKLVGHPAFLPSWEFQKSIPVVWSEYRARIPRWFFYNRVFVGHQQLHIKEEDRYEERRFFTIRQRSYSIRDKSPRSIRVMVQGTDYRWVMKDLPAVKELPYMTSVNDYKAKMWMQMTELRMPNSLPEQFLKTWGDVSEELSKSYSFGRQLKSNRDMEALVAELTEGITDTTEMIRSIYEHMVDSYVWDENHYFLVGENIQKVFEMKRGNSAEINMLMVQLMRDAGLEADPVALSTRSNGKVQRSFPIAQQFNHVIARVKAGDKEHLLDATAGTKALDHLPVKDINEAGLVVKGEDPEWVSLEPPVPTNERIVLLANMDSTGAFKGNVSISSTGYYAALRSSLIDEMGEPGYIDEVLFAEHDTGGIDSSWTDSNWEETGKLDYNVAFDALRPDESQKTGDFYYFNPMFFMRESDNPFKQPERTVPIDYPYLFTKEYIANISIPEGYTVEEVPKPVSVSIPGRSIQLIRLTQVQGNRIMVQSKFILSRKTFKPEEYDYIRGFFAQAMASHDQNVVLKKAAAGSTAADASEGDTGGSN